MRNFIATWGAQVRGNFLVLSVLLVAIGLSLAGLHMKKTGSGSFSVLEALVLVLGVVLTHVSVNLFNEYSDYQTGIDSNTQRTPFSGGSGMIQSGKTTPVAVSTAAWQTLFFAFIIGLYFTIMSHWLLIVIMLIGALSIVFYTRHLASWLLGEFFAGLSLGTLVVIGTFIAMTGSTASSICDLFPADVVLVSIPPGILTSLLLYLNEFPDAEADRKGGRFHLVISLGKRKAAYLYAAGLAATYAFIIAAPLAGVASWWLLIACVTIPVAVKAAVTVLRHYEDTPKLIPAMGMNVMVVLSTDALLALAVVLWMIFAT
jgi:1,4-dihydroxy-2-naphthoate octaprenyltransferase